MSSQNMKRARYDNVYLHSVCSCYLTSWITVLTRVAVASFYTKWPKICQPMTERHFCFPKHMIKIVYATNRTLGSHGHVTKFMADYFSSILNFSLVLQHGNGNASLSFPATLFSTRVWGMVLSSLLSVMYQNYLNIIETFYPVQLIFPSLIPAECKSNCHCNQIKY